MNDRNPSSNQIYSARCTTSLYSKDMSFSSSVLSSPECCHKTQSFALVNHSSLSSSYRYSSYRSSSYRHSSYQYSSISSRIIHRHTYLICEANTDSDPLNVKLQIAYHKTSSEQSRQMRTGGCLALFVRFHSFTVLLS